MKKLLMLCYYFPPLGMGGVQRSAKFAKYLPQFGWQPTVVTVQPIAYWAQDDSLLKELAHIRILATESWDPQRLLAKFKKQQKAKTNSQAQQKSPAQRLVEQMVSFFVLPDSKILWRHHVLKIIHELVKRESFDALYTTSPPHSTHLIGRDLVKRHGFKWVADFRDGWAQGVVVQEPTFLHRRLHQRWQDLVVTEADAVLAAGNGIAELLRVNHAENRQKIRIITNGYDPEDFPQKNSNQDYFTFCHCGSITRFSDPAIILQALLIIKKQNPGIYQRIRVKYVGLDTTAGFEQTVKDLHLTEIVQCHGYLNHRQALQHLVDSQALILVALGQQNAHFIPGKTFEYFGAAKPILAISNVRDTIELLQQYDAAVLCRPEDPQDCAKKMVRLVTKRITVHTDSSFLNSFDRRQQTEQLAFLLNGLCA